MGNMNMNMLSFATLSGCTFLTACSRHVKRHRLEDFLSLLYKLAKCATSKPLVEQVVSSSEGGEGSVVYTRARHYGGVHERSTATCQTVGTTASG